jgi:hypothetical protein
MSFLARLRQWINRDDGKYHQVGNRPISGIDCGLLLMGHDLAFHLTG